jgi:hypothetical protein
MRRLTRALALSLAAAGCSAASGNPPHDAAATLVRMVARDFAFQGGHTVPAGLVAFRLVNLGRATHMMGIARLDSGKTLSDVVRAAQAGAAMPWLSGLGGPGPVAPGDSVTNYLVLQPGTYFIGCYWPDSTGKEHAALGMITTLTVTGQDAGAPALPTPDVYVRETDYHIAMPDTLRAGHHVFRTDNDGPHEHDLAILRLLPGATEAQVQQWLDKPTLSHAPVEAVGGTVGVERWVPSEFALDLQPGRYLFVCLMSDETSSAPHYKRGMSRTVIVE